MSWRDWRERISAWLAIAVIALAPLPFGSVGPTWVASWCVLMAVSLAGARIDAGSRAIAGPIVAAVAAAFIIGLTVALQLGFGGLPDPIWQPAAALLDMKLDGLPSASRLQPLIALGPMLLMTATFCRFLLLAREPARRRRVLKAIAYVGLAHALFGAAAFIIDPTSVLGEAKTAYRTNLTGTFLNRNNAATFFGTITIIWLLLLAVSIRRAREGQLGWGDLLWLLASGSAPRVAWRFAAFVICLGVTAASGSRAGFVLTALALALALTLYAWPAARSIGRRPRLFSVIVMIFVGLLMLEFVGDSVSSRLRLLGFDDEGRYDVYRASLGLLASRPWLGIGLGNFAVVFPSVRPDSVSVIGIWDRAHSTPLELALEIGLPAFSVVALVWLWLLARLAWFASRSRDIAVIAGLATAVLGTLHSLIDFPLQTPGYAVLFAAMAGMGLAGASPTTAGSDRLQPTGSEARQLIAELPSRTPGEAGRAESRALPDAESQP